MGANLTQARTFLRLSIITYNTDESGRLLATVFFSFYVNEVTVTVTALNGTPTGIRTPIKRVKISYTKPLYYRCVNGRPWEACTPYTSLKDSDFTT